MAKSIIIIDYGMGNLTSVSNAVKFLGYVSEITSDKARILAADALILPGVGAFAQAMENLNRLNLIPILNKRVKEQGVPFLGICLGMQLIAESSTEMGLHEGLGWIRARVEEISTMENLPVPHVGWNNVHVSNSSPLFVNIPNESHYYFDHSFHMICTDQKDVIAVCRYGIDLVAAIRHGNIFATQFHPEKSQVIGLKLMRNFLNHVEATGISNEVSPC